MHTKGQRGGKERVGESTFSGQPLRGKQLLNMQAEGAFVMASSPSAQPLTFNTAKIMPNEEWRSTVQAGNEGKGCFCPKKGT